MKARFHMHKDGRMVESDSREMLKWYRTELLKHWFFRARIKHVIQAYPSQIKTNRVYEVNTGKQLFP